jgi:hypothetical protein
VCGHGGWDILGQAHPVGIADVKGCIIIASLAAALVSVGIAAQELPVAELVAKQFNETIRPEAPVAGEDILGVVIGPPTLAADARELYIRKPAHRISAICVSVESRNGRYLAYNNTYRVPASGASGYVAIPIAQTKPLGTQYQEYYSAASVHDLAVLAREGECSERGSTLLPTLWGHLPPPDSELVLTLAVQSGRSTIRMNVGRSGATSEAQCALMKDGQRTAFDTLCEIHVPRSYSGLLSIHLQRCSFDDCADQPDQAVAL